MNNVTMMARRSDALFHSHESRRALCDMIAHREAELDELRSLSAELLLCHRHWGNGPCDTCSMHDEESALCMVYERMHELGVDMREEGE